MTPVEGKGVPLPVLLEQLTEAARMSRTNTASIQLPGGLHVAALIRNDRLALTTWRTASKQPSRKEVEIVARDAKMLLPKITAFERKDKIPAFALADRATGPDQCDHQLGNPLHGDGCGFSFYSWKCLHCQISVTRTQARRGHQKTTFEYGDQLLEEEVFKVLVKRGPKPWPELKQQDADVLRDLTERLRADRLQALGLNPEPQPEPASVPAEVADRPMTASSRPRQTAPRVALGLSTPVDTDEAKRLKAEQKARDEAERQGHILVLSFCSVVQGLRSRWFRQREVLAARLGYLKGAALEDLREERWSRYERARLKLSLRFVLLVGRWRAIFRALPWPLAVAA